MKRTLIILTVFLTSQVLFAIPANLVPNFHHADHGIYTSGQPTHEGFEVLASMGLQTVINVLPEKYCMRDESAIVRQSGMIYRSIPFDTSRFRKEPVEQFAEVLKKAKKPVLIHCSTGNHAGGMWFAYRILYEDAPFDQALAEARAIGMRPELEETIVAPVLQARREQ